jgi:hemoglobin-like flavoprotein
MNDNMSFFEEKFDASYNRLMPDEMARLNFFDRFYHHFFNSSPEIAEQFAHTDMERQTKVIIKAFYALFSFYASQQTEEILEKIALNHNQAHLNIEPKFYDHWLEAFITTVRELDHQCDDHTELAWRLILTPGITFIKFHYDKAIKPA